MKIVKVIRTITYVIPVAIDCKRKNKELLDGAVNVAKQTSDEYVKETYVASFLKKGDITQ